MNNEKKLNEKEKLIINMNKIREKIVSVMGEEVFQKEQNKNGISKPDEIDKLLKR